MVCMLEDAPKSHPNNIKMTGRGSQMIDLYQYYPQLNHHEDVSKQHNPREAFQDPFRFFAIAPQSI